MLWLSGNWFEIMGIVMNEWVLVKKDGNCCECLGIGLKGCELLWMSGNWFEMIGIVVNV